MLNNEQGTVTLPVSSLPASMLLKKCLMLPFRHGLLMGSVAFTSERQNRYQNDRITKKNIRTVLGIPYISISFEMGYGMANELV